MTTTKRAIRIILFVIPLAVLGNLFYGGAFTKNQGFTTIIHVPLFIVAIALAFSLLPWLFSMLRLQLWNRFFKLDLNTRDISEIVLANDVAAAATPTSIGGGYAKMGLLIFHGAKTGLAASLMVLGTIEDTLAMLIIVPICWYFFAPADIQFSALIDKFLSSSAVLPTAIPIVLAVFTGIIVAMRLHPRLRGKLEQWMTPSWWHKRVVLPVKSTLLDFVEAFALISKGGKLFFVANVLLAMVQWTMRYSIFTIIAAGLGLSPHPVHFFLLQWLVFFVMNFVPTPGAIGGAEIAFVLIFKGTLPDELLAAAAGAWRFIACYLQLLIAALLMLVLEKPAIKTRPVYGDRKMPADSRVPASWRTESIAP